MLLSSFSNWIFLLSIYFVWTTVYFLFIGCCFLLLPVLLFPIFYKHSYTVKSLSLATNVANLTLPNCNASSLLGGNIYCSSCLINKTDNAWQLQIQPEWKQKNHNVMVDMITCILSIILVFHLAGIAGKLWYFFLSVDLPFHFRAFHSHCYDHMMSEMDSSMQLCIQEQNDY